MHFEAQPAGAFGAGNAHLFVQAAAFARGLEQAVDRLGNVRIADEDPLDRSYLGGAAGADQIAIGIVGVKHAALLIGDDDAVAGVVDHGVEQWIGLPAGGEMHEACGEREQRKHAHGAEHRQQRHDEGFGVVAADIDQAGGGGDQGRGDQQDQANRTAAQRVRPLILLARRVLHRGILSCHGGLRPRGAAAEAA